MVDATLYMNAEQTAAMLGITVNNLRQIQHRGLLKHCHKEGRRVFYYREDVTLFMRRREERERSKKREPEPSTTVL